MIRFRIKELMAERGLKTGRIKALVQLGISYKVAQNYLNGKRKKVDNAHIEILLHHYRCGLHDLFEWVPDNKLPFDEQHPIQQIKQRKPFNLNDALSKLSPEEIRKKFDEPKE